MRPTNDLINAMQIVSRHHNLCAMNMLVCAHILVRYMRDVLSDHPDAEMINTEASRLAEDVYTYSQSYVEQHYGEITSLSSKRGRPC